MTGDINVRREDAISVIEIRRGPNNFLDRELLAGLADAFERADADHDVRVVLLCSEGRNFCAGANFNDGPTKAGEALDAEPFYREALRLFRCRKPIVAAVQGAAVGAGLGLTLVADFRVATRETRFSANFNRLGIHPGFGLTVTLPRVIGPQRASRLFYTAGLLDGEEAQRLGLADTLATPADLQGTALELAVEIARSAPLAVMSTRQTLREGLADVVEAAMTREAAEQKVQFATSDFAEGVSAAKERRAPIFAGH